MSQALIEALKTVTGNSKAEELAQKREALRLQKRPLETMIVEGLHEDTIDQLRGWVPPNGAYILLEQRKFFIQPDQTLKAGHSLQTIWVEDRPEQQERLRRQIRKGARVIHYANFPKLDDPNPARAAKAKLHSGPTGINPWDQLEKEIRQLMGNDQTGTVMKLEREKQALEVKLAEATKGKPNAKG